MDNGLIMDYAADNTVHVIGIALRKENGVLNRQQWLLSPQHEAVGTISSLGSERFRDNWPPDLNRAQTVVASCG